MVKPRQSFSLSNAIAQEVSGYNARCSSRGQAYESTGHRSGSGIYNSITASGIYNSITASGIYNSITAAPLHIVVRPAFGSPPTQLGRSDSTSSGLGAERVEENRGQGERVVEDFEDAPIRLR
ncbi:hypothetical protein E6O75_ATG10300 [Venturia nashicola]|uniref:Uncharacterized protein n=1 Tax=Venturia nashicola TaxID=86259 RepID=A0A4Z1NCU4_9PEZI|nr:hypothetical protein E6O75_ATG10300 [Venturia nashicola]